MLYSNINFKSLVKAYAPNTFDFNNTDLLPGMYRLNGIGNVINAPHDNMMYGNVLVIKYPETDTLAMIAFSYNPSNDIYYRSGTTSTFIQNMWRTIAFK